VNYTGGEVALGGFTTDARVAFVRINGGEVSAFLVAGGRILRGPGARVSVDEPALLAYRAVADGLGELANQSGVATRVSVSGLAPYDSAALIRPDGTRGRGDWLARGEVVSLDVPAYSRIEFTRGHAPTVAEYEEDVRRGKVRAALEAEARERHRLWRARRAQYAKARAAPVPEGCFALAQAEDFAREGGGKVTVTDRKAAAFGECFFKWDDRGHWVEFDVEIEHEGYYQVVLRYCREGGPVVRSLTIDGEFPHAVARKMEMDGTGGWSNGADNWRYYALEWPLVGKPFLVHLRRGRHAIRLENTSGGGVNLDYVVLAPAGRAVTREAVEK
jgi:hypothetical protein